MMLKDNSVKSLKVENLREALRFSDLFGCLGGLERLVRLLKGI